MPRGFQIKDWMSTKIVSVGPQDSVRRAKLLMDIKNIRFLPVTVGSRLLGIITARNLKNPREEIISPRLKKLFTHPWTIPVKYIMRTKDLVTMLPNDHIETAARMMVKNKISSLPIMEGKDSHVIVGVITTTDLLNALLELLDRGSL